MKVAELQQRLKESQFESEAAGFGSRAVEDSPWYVRLMLAFGAWLAALLLLVALGMFRLLDSDSSRMLVGVVLSLVAWVLGRTRGDFFSQLRLALSLAGLGCLISVPSLADLQSWLVTEHIILVLLFAVCQDGRLRMFIVATSGAVVAYASHRTVPYEILFSATSFLLALVWFQRERWWLNRWRWACYPLAYGLTAVLYGYLWLVHYDPKSPELTRLSTVLLTLLGLWATARIQRSMEMGPLSRMGIFLAAGLLGLSTWSSPGASVGYTLLLLSYYCGEFPLRVIAVVFLLTSGSLHYYDLSWTLNSKALVLLASGALLLGLVKMIESPAEDQS